MPIDNKPSTANRRLIVLALILTFGFSVIAAQLWFYQVVMHDELLQKAIDQRVRWLEITPKRGRISDAHGNLLAMNVTQWDISVSPNLVSDPKELADQLAEILDMPWDELYAKLNSDSWWTPLAQDVPHEVGEKILALDNYSILCDPHPYRVYPEGNLVAHILGLVTKAGTGFIGIEGFFNQQLSGVSETIRAEQSPVGVELPTSASAENPTIAGTNLVLTIDRNIQHIAEEELHRALDEYGAKSGTVIVMDPQTGALLASVSYPVYGPSEENPDEEVLLQDPAVSSMWEPGSIFKIVTWAAALDAGVISPGMQVHDDGSLEVGGRIIRNWDRRGHGLVTMQEALVQSLNTIASYISTTMGKDRFYTYLRRFGFGQLTNVDLDSEGPGMMKQPGDPNWFPSDLGTNSFGQGIAVTPMQMISAASVVANKGLLMKPYVVRQFVTTDRETGEVKVIQKGPTIERRAISQQTAETMTGMLTAVVEQGATKAQVSGYRIAGKTGTAQVPTAYGYHPDDTIASFIGFAPADDPQFIVLVKLDKPQKSPWGSQTAAPTFRAIAKRLFVYLQIPPDSIRLAQR